MKNVNLSISTRGTFKYANGYQKAQLRLEINRKPNFYIIPVAKFLPENWDRKNKQVKKNTPGYAQINSQINFFYSKGTDILRNCIRDNRMITFKSFEKELFNKGYETDFFEYAEKHANKYDKSSRVKKMGIFAKLKEFNKGKTLSFGEIDETLLRNFMAWCMNVKNNREVTAQKAVEIIRTCLNDAIKDGIIKDNPVNKIKLKEFEGKRNALTSEAVKLLIEYLHTEKLRYLQKQRLSGFIFACCCYGLRWSDIRKMKFNDLQGNILEVTEVKTKKHRTLIIMQSAIKLIDFSRNKNGEQFIFDMGINSSPTNNLLKEIANKINAREGREVVGKKITIQKKGTEIISNSVSFHSARATFETIAENHTDIYTAARLTGNTPKVAANSYISTENKEKDKKALSLIENDFFN